MTNSVSAEQELSEDLRHRGLGARVFAGTFEKRGAKLGACWLGVLIFAAVFAPLLANSRPLLLSIDGVVSSPAARYFTATDVTLVVVFILALLLFLWRRVSVGRVFLILVISGIGVYAISQYSLNPPKLSIYESFRETQIEQRSDWVVNAPIPYSPKDYLRDYGDTGLQAPAITAERAHFFGTEENGADLLSRMIHASRLALGIGFVATGIAMVLGVIIGGLMGFFSGVIDMLGMRIVEIFESVPTLFLLLTFVAFFDRSLYIICLLYTSDAADE